MSRDIFLHEIIDIVGQNQWAYMEHTISCSGDEANGLVLLGTWYTVGCTGRWPQVISSAVGPCPTVTLKCSSTAWWWG